MESSHWTPTAFAVLIYVNYRKKSPVFILQLQPSSVWEHLGDLCVRTKTRKCATLFHNFMMLEACASREVISKTLQEALFKTQVDAVKVVKEPARNGTVTGFQQICFHQKRLESHCKT